MFFIFSNYKYKNFEVPVYNFTKSVHLVSYRLFPIITGVKSYSLEFVVAGLQIYNPNSFSTDLDGSIVPVLYRCYQVFEEAKEIESTKDFKIDLNKIVINNPIFNLNEKILNHRNKYDARINLSDYKLISGMSNVLSSALNYLSQISKKYEKSNIYDIIKNASTEEATLNLKASEIEDFINTYRILNIIIGVNMPIIHKKLGIKAKNNSFYSNVLKTFKQRSKMSPNLWNYNTKVLDSYKTLVENELFLEEEAFTSLSKKIEGYGIRITEIENLANQGMFNEI